MGWPSVETFGSYWRSPGGIGPWGIQRFSGSSWFAMGGIGPHGSYRSCGEGRPVTAVVCNFLSAVAHVGRDASFYFFLFFMLGPGVPCSAAAVWRVRFSALGCWAILFAVTEVILACLAGGCRGWPHCGCLTLPYLPQVRGHGFPHFWGHGFSSVFRGFSLGFPWVFWCGATVSLTTEGYL